jgi:hypothetical protein
MKPTLPNPPRRMSAKETYSIAHSAQCKLQMAANAPDRNLRFVLGHAFTLDKVLLRIVEIENSSVKDELDNAQPEPVSEIQAQDDLRSSIGGGAGVTVGETGSLARPQRRISFSNQKAPSEVTGQKSSRARSPPPKKIPKGYEDDQSTSSDDYDDEPMEFARAMNPPSSIKPPADAWSDEDDDYEGDTGAGLGLTRFASASAAPPRKRAPSPPPMSESDSEEDEEPPKSPPSFPDDLVRGVMVEGNEDNDLHTLYESVRGCPCGKDHGVAPESKGMWEIKGEQLGSDYEGKRYGVVRV